MRVVVQRVSQAAVEIDGRTVGGIKTGLLLLVGIEKGDGEKEIEFMADKILNLRIFADNEGKMNLSVQEIRGEILSVSQFTLASRIKKGRRPDFSNAEDPEKAEALYSRFNVLLAKVVPVGTGVFGAMMNIHSVNNGPVTIIIEKNPAD
ncbi:MAG: D-tyrosyl-tRNA(Tyr) deacylase [Acidobacteria bacterium]|nr:D-tyrosyl-tRNA(Tyr) deacylase [Acidobacteriota bacterium]MBU4405062.1 D-tyrosyl-tRNA(Tyr) deacylase [Acidobacteriota bacterium]MCG2811688.1 D-aminoacyl-tRNA deacylase [Candidatus Aminicenantes bacterium]